MKIQLIALLLFAMVAYSQAKPEKSFKHFASFQKGLKTVKDLAKSFLNLITPSKGTRKTVEMTGGKPKFCKKYECPSFVVKKSSSKIELRCYKSAYWVSTKATGSPSFLGGTTSKMFEKLFDYIRGENKMGVEINMTVPVLNEIKDDGKDQDLKMSFYIPEKCQKNPPKPKSSDVFIEKRKFCAYVHSFSGYVMFNFQYLRHLKMLKEGIAKEWPEDKYVKGVYYTAGYDKPTQVTDRHNEVMLMQME